MAFDNLLSTGLIIGAIALAAQYILAYLRSPLKKVPGPFLAKFSNIWRFVNHYQRKHIETQQRLHTKYGDAVCIGPNTVSLADPNLIKTIYSTRGTFLKSEFYTVNDAIQDGHRIQNMFGTRSNEFHAKQIKPVQKLYSFQSAYELEPMMNGSVRTLCDELEQRFMRGENKGQTCDIADWISYLCWDFLGEMTFSRRMGFMEEGRDVGNMIVTAEKVMRYFSVIGQMPALDMWLAKNPYLATKFPNFSGTAGFCVQRFMERMQNLEQYKDEKDFMNGFLQAKEEYPDLVTDNEVIGYLIINILGGADTTAIVMKAIFYYILKNPAVKERLVAELKAANLAFPSSYQILEGLPYLDACVKEGLRMHPVAGHILERVVPSTGLTLSNGVTLPPGTVVGMNPWVIHRTPSVFGERVEEYVPERWLQGPIEDNEAYEARIRKMKDADMSFGNGNRQCLGRPLALVELYKVTAMLFAKYKIDLEDPTQDWELDKTWFVWPHKIRVKMSPY